MVLKMPICTTCATYTPFLYTLYESAYNLRLEQCQNCQSFVDSYVEHDTLILLLDLILLKRGVYRHLLYNRGSKPRRPIGKDDGNKDLQSDNHKNINRERWMWTIKLGTTLVFLDAFIRWSYLNHNLGFEIAEQPEDFLLNFSRVFFGCLAETLAFHFGIILACFTAMHIAEFIRSRFKVDHMPKSDISCEFHLSLVPLTLFYSSLTKLFLLFLLAIWLPSSPHIRQPQTNWFQEILSQSSFTATLYQLSRIFDDDVINREWIIRNIIGGMSAGFGLRVILDIPPIFSTLIILSGWVSKNIMAQTIGGWVGGDHKTSQAWLAYSIP